MTSHLVSPRRSGGLIALALLCALAWPADGPCAQAGHDQNAVASLGPTPGPSAPAAAVTAWSWSQVYSPIESMLGNRRRMIQVLIVLMCVGLYIMMRKVSDE